MSKRERPMVMMESLEPRNLMAADAGAFLVATPPLSSNTFLLSQQGGVVAVQLNADEGPAEAISLQAGNSLDLTGISPTSFLNQQFSAQPAAVPAVLPDSMVEAPPLE